MMNTPFEIEDPEARSAVLLSRSGQYALLALLLLAQQRDGAPMRVGDVAEALEIPANYLSKLLHRLARAGVLQSVRGPKGGFRLARPADRLSLVEALAPIEADGLDRRCLLGRPECRDDDPCAAHEQWSALSAHIDQFLTETTLASLQSRDPGAGRSRRPARKRPSSKGPKQRRSR